MARPGPDPALVARAAELAESMNLADVAAALEAEGTPVPLRTLQRWLPGRPKGAPRLADGEGSRWTLQRQRARAGGDQDHLGEPPE